MLQRIREVSTGWIAGAIVTLLILSFALFGVGSYFSESTEPYVAKVNDTEIKQTEFQRAIYNIRQQMQQTLGTQIDAEDPMLKQQAVSQLVDSEVINQAISDSNLDVEDIKVIETINSIELFHSDDGFNESLYQRSVNLMGSEPAVFEAQVRLDMLSEQLQSSVSESAFTTSNEIEQLVRLKKQQRDFSYVVVSARKIAESIEASEEEISSYYEANKSLFTQPRQVKIQYLDLTVEKVMEQIEVSEEDLQIYHSNNKLAYNDPEKRKLWQIKIGKPQDASPEEKAKADEKAEQLLEVMKSGESFEVIAETYSSSSDDAVKVDISESGFTQKGVFPAEVDDVLFGMDKENVSDPIETDNAIHIVKLIDIQESKENSFDEVKDRVKQDLTNEIAQKKFFELADQLAALSYEHPDTLEVASDAIDISVEESEYFTREGTDTGLTSFTRLVENSFSDDVLKEGNNSEALELADDRVVVLRVSEVIEAGQKELDAVKDEVIARVIEEKAREKSKQIGDKLLQSAESGDDLDTILKANNLELKTGSEISRDDININRSILRLAFRMEKPESDAKNIEGTQMGNGDYALVLLDKVSYPEKLLGIDLTEQKRAMQRVRAESDWEGYFEQLKESSEIEILSDNL